jgi:hypothetical protein
MGAVPISVPIWVWDQSWPTMVGWWSHMWQQCLSQHVSAKIHHSGQLLLRGLGSVLFKTEDQGFESLLTLLEFKKCWIWTQQCWWNQFPGLGKEVEWCSDRKSQRMDLSRSLPLMRVMEKILPLRKETSWESRKSLGSSGGMRRTEKARGGVIPVPDWRSRATHTSVLALIRGHKPVKFLGFFLPLLGQEAGEYNGNRSHFLVTPVPLLDQ